MILFAFQSCQILHVWFYYFRNIRHEQGSDVKARLWEGSREGVTDSVPSCSNESHQRRPSQVALKREASVCGEHTPINTMSNSIKVRHHHDIPYFKCRMAGQKKSVEGGRVHAEVNTVTNLVNAKASVREPDTKWFEAIWNALVALLVKQRCGLPHKRMVYNARWKHPEFMQTSTRRAITITNVPMWMLISLRVSSHN